MEKRESLPKTERTLYDILGVVIIISQILCMGLCVYRNKIALKGGKLPLTFIIEIIIMIFTAFVMIKEYNFMDNYIIKIYNLFNRMLCALNWIFVVILIAEIIIRL